MLKLNDFIKKYKAPILWTVGYVFALWIIFHILFNFEIFNRAHWIRAAHVHFRGLAGLTFCLLVASAIPLYIATIIIVIRTQKPLFTIPVPEPIKKIFTKPGDDKTAEPENKNESETTEQTDTIPERFPTEMRGFFARARAHPNRVPAPVCSVCSVNPNIYPTAPDTPTTPENTDSDLPLPPDFDTDDSFAAPSAPSGAPSAAPVFQDINLYGDDFADNAPWEEDKPVKNSVTEYFEKNNREFSTAQQDIIITPTSAIVVHDDPEFWIMDDPTWFAAGKTRESPIQDLLTVAAENNVKPVLYLGATNIMNFDAKCDEWKSKGITIITDISKL